MKLSENTQGNHGSNRHPIDHWVVRIPIIHPPLLHNSVGAHVGLVFDESPIWSSISLEVTYENYGIIPIKISSYNQGLLFVNFMSTSTKYSL